MQKLQHRKHFLACYLSALIFVYGYCSAATLGVPNSPRPQITSTFHSAQTNNIFTWKKTKKVSPLPARQSNGEIWGRVRNHLNLNLSKPSPLYQQHLRSFARSQDYINKVIRNASPYFFFILEEVEKRGMPSEIALLPIIESDFDPHCISSKGAAGLWQIMPRMHGLKQNAWYDGRKDVYESTKVALDHLVYLHKRFNGNWLLALAAYNSGEGRVQKAIKKNRNAKKPTDFWSLKLPKETTHFVPKLLALAKIVKSPKEYGITLPSIPNAPVFTRINTGKAIDIAHAAKLVDMSESQLRKLNPGMHKKGMNPSGPFHLLVPVNQANIFKQKITKMPASSSSAVPTSSKSITAKKKTGDVSIVRKKAKSSKKAVKYATT